MNKDVIYIDVDDDITAIIGKIKESQEKIVALVPPKHVGILQSAINLRLLDRMAKADKKSMVIVTNNQGLMALAASARIPVAKNLQSKPEVAAIPALAVDRGDDIINGADLPIGDHAGGSANDGMKVAATAIPVRSKPTRDDAVETLEIEEAPTEPVLAVAAAKAGKKASKNKVKIPNFSKFRKRLFLAIIGALLLTGALVWAYGFAPAATVIITANTVPAQVSGTIKLGGTAATDFKSGIVSSEEQQLQQNATVQFTATGQKDVGKPATGTVSFSTNAINVINANNGAGTTIPAGTKLTSGGGLVFTTDQAVTINSTNYNNAPVTITATASGTQYNGVSGSMTGAPTNISAQIPSSSPTANGTSQVVTVVSDSDIQLALAQITGQSTDAARKAVEAQFKNGEYVIDGSFTATPGTPVSNPASGAQVGADGKATLTVPMTYTVYGFPKTAIDTYLTANLTSQLSGSKNQRIYDNGDTKVGFSNFTKASDGTMTVDLTTSGLIGPQIDETAVKNSIRGMVTGTVQSTLGSISGIQNVDVHYSYFWVNQVPNDINKITIEFKLANG